MCSDSVVAYEVMDEKRLRTYWTRLAQAETSRKPKRDAPLEDHLSAMEVGGWTLVAVTGSGKRREFFFHKK